jgi:hypothetical protein
LTKKILLAILPLIFVANIGLAAPITTAAITDGLGNPWPCTFGTWCKSVPLSPVGLYVSLTCSGSCAATYYCMNGPTCTPNVAYNMGGPFLSGTSYVRYFSTDNLGVNESVKTSIVKVDDKAPITSVSAALTNGTAYVFGTASSLNVRVTLSCSDTASGCSSTSYCTDTANTCAPNTAYSTPVTISTAGSSYIRYRSVDAAGNTETINSQKIQIGAAPTTTATATNNNSVAYAFGTWTSSPFMTVTLSCAPAAGTTCGTTLYCTDVSGPCTPNTVYTVPVNVVSLSVPVFVSFKSNTTTGLNEVEKTQTIMFDKSAPSTGAGAVNNASTAYAFGIWSNSSFVRVTLSCADPAVPNSGCNVTSYCTDTANTCVPNMTYAVPVQISTSGVSYIRYASTDNAGNSGAVDTRAIMLGGVSPVTTATATTSTGVAYAFNAWTSSPYVNVTLSCTDAGGPGCGTTMYCADAANACTPNLPYSTPVQISTIGTSYIRYVSNDTFGTSNAVQNQTINIDITLPVTAWSAVTSGGVAYVNNTWTTSPYVNVTLSCTDAGGSGCGTTMYCTDTSNLCTPNLPYSAAVQIVTPSVSYLRFMSTDTAGNSGAVSSLTVMINVVSPVTTATAIKNDSTAYTFGVLATSPYINVTLSCTDLAGPGCGTTMYCTDLANTCAPNTTYSTPVQVSTQGTSYIRYVSNDTAGVTEIVKSQTIMLSACQTGADTNGDGIISLTEILAYINNWNLGTVLMTDLLKAIGLWQVGVGC